MPASFLFMWSSRPLRTVAAALATGVLLAACSKAPPPEEPVRAVKVMTVGESRFGSSVEYAGEVKARVESRLGFRVAGKITQRQVEVGQRVRAGQVLAQLDAQDYRLATDAARAQVTAAQTQRDLAAADSRRYQSLKEQNFISGAELERREATLKAAQATLDQARAQLAAQGNQASYTQLVADAPGVVTAVEAEVGQVVSAGTPVVRVAQDGPRDVLFAVPEDRVAVWKPGMPMTVRAWMGAAPLPATVREVAASADPVTRTYAVKLALAGAEVPPLGATVTVIPASPATATPPVLKLPTSALWQQGAGAAVWVLDPASMTVRAQPVQVVTVDGNEAVIGAGLQAGQQVVTAGVHVLAPGQKVMLYKPKHSTSAVNAAPEALNPGAKAPARAASAPSVR